MTRPEPPRVTDRDGAARPRVDLYRIDLEPPAREIEKLRAQLSDDERARAGRFKFDTHRHRWIAGRGMLRAILSGYVGSAPSSLELQYEAHGKPRLPADDAAPRVHFNLSHSSRLALLAVTVDVPVGVDVERLKPLRDIDAVVDRFFSVAERRDFARAQGDEARLEAFYACWTRKEAYLKAIGCGIFQPTDSFDVTLLPGDAPAIVAIEGDGEAARDWSLHALDVAPGYVGAVATRSRGEPDLAWRDTPAA